MQLLCNVDTLCKSRKDAEEERKETSDSAGAANNERELQSGWRDEENEHVDYLGRETAAQAECLDVAAVEKYLTYNNPRITSFPNHCFVSSALLAAKSLGVLPSNRVSAEFFSTACVSRFEHSDENRPRSFHVPDGVTEATAEAWKERIGNEVLKLRQRRRSSSAESTSQATIGSTVASSSDHSQYGTMTRNECIDAIFKNVSTQFGLNEAQCRAYDLFLKPLKRRLTSQPTSGHEVDNRCMYLGGAGGTGKSRVIEAIIEAVRQLDCTEQLLVCATTGIAASLINGSTVDSLLKLRRGRTRYKEGDDLQQANNEASYSNIIDNTWMTCNSLILDEVSMLGCSKVTSISKTLEKNKSNSLAFGGVNILFCGDFHQLPAIGDVSLFRKASTTRKDSEAVKLGMYLWSQVTKTTVLLKEHYRAPDPTVYQVMERLRRGALTAADIEKIKSRVFGHPEGPDPSDVKWQDAPLITPRNTIRQAWNNLAAVRYGIRTQKQVFLSPSIDLGVQCDRDAMIWTGDHKTDMLATWNVLCIDAMAIVTANIAVEMKIAKGSRVIIREVVPHPEDHEGWRTIHSHQVVRLARPPITVFVEPVISESQQSYNYHRRNHPTWFPIMAMKQTITIPKEFGGESVSTCDKTTFDRIQIPLTSGFSMSDFRVQGSGLNKGIFDLKKPPTGRMVLQNIYTMLSRVSNWEDLAILRPFEDCVLQLRVDDELTEYDETLERMDLETQRRVAMEET